MATLMKTVSILGGAALLVTASALGLVACSSSSTPPAATADSGVPTGNMDTGTVKTGDSDTVAMGDSATAPPADTGSGGTTDTGSCEQPPTLHPETAAGVYCPFSSVNGGSNITCAAGQQCCETPESSSASSTCVARGAACPVAGSTLWECTSPLDCTGATTGTVCCGGGSPSPLTACGVTWTEYPGFTGSQCVTSCPAPGFVICESNADCAGSDAGTTCQPSKEMGGQVGFCAP